jgi:4'-phosphopantetheinyl transferase
MTNTLIYWNLTDSTHLPESLNWLSGDESLQFQGFRFQKRRNDWLLGRWTVKRLIQSIYSEVKDLSSNRISIKNEASGAPYALIDGDQMKESLSLSHRENLGVSAICKNPDVSIGIDLEEIESKSHGFIEDYFTSQESNAIFALPAEQQSLIASLFWSGREAIMKAMQTGLRIDTREIAFQCPSLNLNDEWQPMVITHAPVDMKLIQLFWKKLDNFVITLAVISADEPIKVSPENIIQQ